MTIFTTIAFSFGHLSRGDATTKYQLFCELPETSIIIHIVIFIPQIVFFLILQEK